MTESENHFDTVIIGSGFAGSLLAWVLSKHGRKVALLDRARHPRFAVGESSTPVADLLIDQIADEFSLAELGALSRWGTARTVLPELRIGKKRGFSYFAHRDGRPFRDDARHTNSLMVAASATDAQSDLHWMRSDVDRWFFQRARAAGAQVLENISDLTLQKSDSTPAPIRWTIQGTFQNDCAIEGREVNLTSDFRFTTPMLVDSSGAGGVVGDTLGIRRLDDQLTVRTGAIFGHFHNVGSVLDIVADTDAGLGGANKTAPQRVFSDRLEPFHPDDAAQHHLLEDGWVWMLRFLDGTTSVGIVRTCRAWKQAFADPSAPSIDLAWRSVCSQYPSLNAMLKSAELVAPLARTGQPELRYVRRLSRLWEQCAGPGWFMLPNTAGIVDPLHSTGIAHALSGVQRVARCLLYGTGEREARHWRRYTQDVIEEIRWIDRVVGVCYQSAEVSFEAFIAACSLYFIAAIQCERRLALGDSADGFLMHRSDELRRVLNWWSQELLRVDRQRDNQSAIRTLVAKLRLRIEPWNDVGLLDPSQRNRLARTVAPK